MFHKPKEVKSVKDFCKISVQSPLGLPLCVPGKLIGIWIPRYRNSNILKKLDLFFSTRLTSLALSPNREEINQTYFQPDILYFFPQLKRLIRVHKRRWRVQMICSRRLLICPVQMCKWKDQKPLETRPRPQVSSPALRSPQWTCFSKTPEIYHSRPHCCSF